MKTENPNPTATAEKKVYTVAEVAIMLNVHPNTVYKLVKKKAFASRKIGTDIRISKTSLENWFNQNQ